VLTYNWPLRCCIMPLSPMPMMLLFYWGERQHFGAVILFI
jgi:hypothetical protein